MPLISDAVQIWRAAEGDYHIEWAASHPDTQVRVDPLGGHGQVQAHYEEAAPRARIAGLPAARRHQFRLSDQHGNEVLAMERKLGMQGTPNFRDFGGYRGADGRRVRWGYLYRSGQLSGLTPQDLELLDSLQLDLVCDFRREDEQQSSPSRYPEARQPQVASLPIREILQRQDTRFLVHCAAGKDRTGFAVAVILLALGVSVEQVMEDYMLTARFYHPQREVDRLRAKYGLESVPEEAILPMLEVHEAYLARALEAIRDYGAVETYLEDVLGVGSAEREELRRRYLE